MSDKSKKAVFITDAPYFADRRAQRCVEVLCQMEDLRVTVIDQGVDLNRSRAALPVSVGYRPLPVPAGKIGRLFWHLNNRLNSLKAQRLRNDWCQRALTEIAPDLIHVVNVFSLEAVADFVRQQCVPFIYEPYEYWPEHLHSTVYGLDSALACHLAGVEQRSVPQAAQLITVSPLLGKWYREDLGARDFKIVYSSFGDASPQEDEDRQDNLSGDGCSSVLRVVHSGNLAKNRNVAVLINALTEVRNYEVIIQGQGPEQASLTAQVERLGLQNSVMFQPVVPINEVITSLRKFDIGFIGSDACTRQTDGALPNKLFDYLAAGLPVLAFRTSALADLPGINDFAILVNPATPGALAEALKSLQKNPSRLAALRLGARKQRALYTDEAQRTTLRELYCALLNKDGNK